MLAEIAAVESAVLHSAETVDRLILVELVGLGDDESSLVGALGARLECGGLFLQEGLAVCGGEGEQTGAAVDGDLEGGGLQPDG